MSGNIPSFTLIIESENLASCKPEEIKNMFDSLLNQTMSIAQANEIIIGNNGLIPNEILNEINQIIPNLKQMDVKRKITYYQAKNMLAKEATGDIIVFCDSDCIYEPQWLEMLLDSFNKKTDAMVIAGETVIDVKGYYSLAMAVNYMLHRQNTTDSNELKKCKFYYLNNVAFRREFFIQNPIPDNIKIFRGTCSVHSKQIGDQGISIWKNFAAKSYHLPPQNLKYYFLRFLLMGHDHYWLDQLLVMSYKQSVTENLNSSNEQASLSGALKKSPQLSENKTTHKLSLSQRFNRKYNYWMNQFKVYSEEYKLKKIDIVLAIPIVIFSQGLITIGRLITQINSLFSKEPHWLYRFTFLLD